MEGRLKLYFAAPLFNEAEQGFNRMVCERLEAWHEVFLPQRDGLLLADLIQGGMAPAQAEAAIYRKDVDALNKADVLVLLMDGRTVDEGSAWEAGYMAARKGVGHAVESWGLKTDIRQLMPWGDSPMLKGGLDHMFTSVRDLEAHAEAVARGWGRDER